MANQRAVDVRREPEQKRSRAGVSAILQATAELLNTTGVDQLTMTSIASRAGLSKAAIYRYFPNKAAVLRELAQQTFERDSERLATQLVEGSDPSELITGSLRVYLERHRSEPFRIQLRAAVRADPELSRLDLEDSRRNANAIAILLRRHSTEPNLDSRVLLVLEMMDSAVRLVSMVDEDEGSRTIDNFLEMTRTFLLD